MPAAPRYSDLDPKLCGVWVQVLRVAESATARAQHLCHSFIHSFIHSFAQNDKYNKYNKSM